MEKDIFLSFLLDVYGPLLTGKQKDALEMYYNMDFSLSEIAENIGVTRQCARDFIKKGEAHLLEFEEKAGIYKKLKIIFEEAAKIREEVCGIEKKNVHELLELGENIKARIGVIITQQ